VALSESTATFGRRFFVSVDAHTLVAAAGALQLEDAAIPHTGNPSRAPNSVGRATPSEWLNKINGGFHASARFSAMRVS
jgi:hypothetical protein